MSSSNNDIKVSSNQLLGSTYNSNNNVTRPEPTHPIRQYSEPSPITKTLATVHHTFPTKYDNHDDHHKENGPANGQHSTQQQQKQPSKLSIDPPFKSISHSSPSSPLPVLSPQQLQLQRLLFIQQFQERLLQDSSVIVPERHETATETRINTEIISKLLDENTMMQQQQAQQSQQSQQIQPAQPPHPPLRIALPQTHHKQPVVTSDYHITGPNEIRIGSGDYSEISSTTGPLSANDYPVKPPTNGHHLHHLNPQQVASPGTHQQHQFHLTHLPNVPVPNGVSGVGTAGEGKPKQNQLSIKPIRPSKHQSPAKHRKKGGGGGGGNSLLKESFLHVGAISPISGGSRSLGGGGGGGDQNSMKRQFSYSSSQQGDLIKQPQRNRAFSAGSGVGPTGERSGAETPTASELTYGDIIPVEQGEDYDSDYWEDERQLLKWEARRLGVLYLGIEEVAKHCDSMRLTEEERMALLMR
jgi:hypothetical protein